tara:strand:+ start:1040 stop:1282 length:243 start_codon:yes stop_codon:yes gene_type:complete
VVLKDGTKQTFVVNVKKIQSLTKQKNNMKVNETAWINLKKQIEMHLKEDPNLTDVAINYQVKIPTFGTRNYLNLNVSINK